MPSDVTSCIAGLLAVAAAAAVREDRWAIERPMGAKATTERLSSNIGATAAVQATREFILGGMRLWIVKWPADDVCVDGLTADRRCRIDVAENICQAFGGYVYGSLFAASAVRTTCRRPNKSVRYDLHVRV